MKHLLITIVSVMLVGCGPSVDIHQAATEGNIEAVKQHLASGTDVNTEGGWRDTTPLHYSIHHGHKEIAEMLIANGADVNPKSVINTTLLHLAAVRDYKEIAELLITEGADVNAKDGYGETPLDSVIGVFTETADLLRKHGGKSGAEYSIFSG